MVFVAMDLPIKPLPNAAIPARFTPPGNSAGRHRLRRRSENVGTLIVEHLIGEPGDLAE